jgi:hypothetical protein
LPTIGRYFTKEKKPPLWYSFPVPGQAKRGEGRFLKEYVCLIMDDLVKIVAYEGKFFLNEDTHQVHLIKGDLYNAC